MTTLLDRIDPEAPAADREGDPGPSDAPADRLRATMAACRVQFTWLGIQKSLTPEQRAAAAGAFDADGRSLSAGKKLILDVAHPAFRAVTAVRGQVESYWRSLTLPFPEPGVRLIRQENVDEFARRMAGHRADLDHAVAALDRHYGELRESGRDRLGSLYNEADYPATLVGLFGVGWDFPSLEPPGYLVALSPAVYEQERARVAARFEEAVALAEAAFADELARLVEHLCERLSGSGDDGQPKVFRDSAVGNLREFFDRFRELNVRSNPAELDRPGRAGKAGLSAGAGRAGAARPVRASGSGSRRGCPTSAGRSTRCWSTGRVGGSSRQPAGNVMDLVVDPQGRIQVALQVTRRSTSPRSGPSRSPGPASSSGTRRAAGSPTWRPSEARRWGRSRGGARRSPPSAPGSRPAGRPRPESDPPGITILAEGPTSRPGRARPRPVRPRPSGVRARGAGLRASPSEQEPAP